MGYVRTKDGIYEEGKFLNPLNVRCECADTIEELCDKFVRITSPNTKYETAIILHGRDDLSLIKNKHVDYGAIWTDKGLTYVAEYDPKGKRWKLL